MCETLQLSWKLPGPAKGLGNDDNNNNNNKEDKSRDTKSNKSEAPGKYGLRACSIKKREARSSKQKGPPKKRGPKPRPKPQPMSKYRRKTANLRERMRMGEINTAFEKLRSKIPTPLGSPKSRHEKLTKINILHVAINYIRALESILDTGDAGVQIYGTSMVRRPFDNDEECPYMDDEDYEDQQQPQPQPHLFFGRSNSKEAKKASGKKKAATSRAKKHSSCESSDSNSSSEDSGIIADEEEEDDDDAFECPDWTELTSTLDLGLAAEAASGGGGGSSSGGGGGGGSAGLDEMDGRKKGFLMKTNADTLLTSLAQQLTPTSPPIDMDVKLLMPSFRAVLQSLDNKANGNLLRQASFPDLGQENLFLNDLSELDALPDINFSHEDPFQLFI